MANWMTEPVIVPRAEHSISRRDIDPDALKVLYRLQQFNYTAYLVGGSVRDLLLSKRPKDFDIGTSAHPYQIKKLFRNCWIIGRRFRLAHVRFGPKTIEVATFRRNIPPGTENEPAEPAVVAEPPESVDPNLLIHHDNTFGTPEEDAFRRDFTINALFYDIATFSIIDYVGGLQDLRDGIIRSIGDPNQRFQEDPVRMLRAVVMAARLDFKLDPPVAKAIAKHRQLLGLASPARLIEEYYKILRSGAAERTFQGLAELGLLEVVTPELMPGARDGRLNQALEALDDYRRGYEAPPPTLTNSILLGSLIVPLGLMPRRAITAHLTDESPHGDATEDEEPPIVRRGTRSRRPTKEPPLKIGILMVARRDTDRLRQALALQRRLLDLDSSPRAKRVLIHRGSFEEALTWLQVHGDVPEITEHWRGFVEALQTSPEGAPAAASAGETPGDEAVATGDQRRRGRRRRRRRRRIE